MAYLYRHIRLDTNQPFYIGIGKDDGGLFKRAKIKSKRNPIWRNITRKSDYRIEIVLDDLTWDEAQQKEREFIAIYGRMFDGGVLSNMTIGGDGHTGMYGALNKRFGVPMSESTKAKMKDSFKKTAEALGSPWIKKKTEKVVDPTKKRPWNYGKKTGLSESIKAAHKRQEKKVLQIDVSGRYFIEYHSVSEAAKIMGFHKGNISNACRKRRGAKTYQGFIWEYTENVSPDNVKLLQELVQQRLIAPQRPLADSDLRREFLYKLSSDHQVQVRMAQT